MRSIFFVFSALLLFVAPGFAQNTSVYTPTSDKICKAQKIPEAGDYVGICPGTAGYKIELIEGDLRQTLNIIPPNKKKHELNLTSFYSAFSAVGEKLEWRLKKGVPVALIARYNVADPEGVGKGTSYLMVAKISKTGSCVTDVVPPGAKQNEEARTLADAAISKPCKSKE
ncbi:MAG: hypothetical protein QM785_11360 [Pyrinomonadaceae bacterium]